MHEIIARCGNRCNLCPLYRENFNPAEIEEVNERLYKYHHASQGPRPQYTKGCDGCLSEGYIAREGCAIRECATRKGFRTCIDCPDLFCDLLKADMEVVEGALARRRDNMPQEDYDRYFKPFLIREVLTQRNKMIE